MGANFNHLNWIRSREVGLISNPRHYSNLMNSMYYNISLVKSWEYPEDEASVAGGIFNLDFSPDGSILVAACEKKNILLFDPVAQKSVFNKQDAHSDCVNCVRFLNNRTFATCSDDRTIAVWDARNLNERLTVLTGHSNWVKNIEYSDDKGLLVTSGFDGSVYTWNINECGQKDVVYHNVLNIKGLMRMKLTPDGSKMVVCTTHGYMIIIHDLDLETMLYDLNNLKPTIYKFVSIGDGRLPRTVRRTHIFDRKRTRNRVEFIFDFPEDDQAEMISSLQVHPEGWCVASRNVTENGNSEWTCVHNIEDCPENEDGNVQNWFYDLDAGKLRPIISKQNDVAPSLETLHIAEDALQNSEGTINADLDVTILYENDTFDYTLEKTSAAVENINDRGSLPLRYTDTSKVLRFLDHEQRNSRVSDTGCSTIPWTGVVNSTLRTAIFLRPKSDDGVFRSSFINQYIFATVAPSPPSIFPNYSNGDDNVDREMYKYKLRKNRYRLTDYIGEMQTGRGFIKELCFSPDGQVICSPFLHGIRLLKCPEKRERSQTYGFRIDSEKQRATALTEITSKMSYEDTVLCTKFAPHRCLIVSGSLTGKLMWYQPVF